MPREPFGAARGRHSFDKPSKEDVMCTTLIVTKGASADGSMMVAHSDDDELFDQRLIYVPANPNPAKMRKVFAEHYRFPRIVTDDRGPGYQPTAGQALTEPIGYIPQKKPTYAYFDGNFGIMNEHNLMIGECTNGAKFQPKPVSREQAEKEAKRMRIMFSTELSRIALERAKTAEDAITVMGEMIEEYGYYGTGETLLVADEDEAWVFEMCALPDDIYHSAWVAQQVPDGTVFVAANEFRIRKIDPANRDKFRVSKLLEEGLEKVGWWNPNDGPIDWLRAVSHGEYNHPYYSLRRVWRVLDRVNPDLGLSPWVKDGFTEDYPFSVKPKRKLSVQDVFSLYRDHYEGTQFDLTRGVAAGPYGDPHRFAGLYDGAQNNITEEKVFYGAWERAISVFYQGYTFVNQIRVDTKERKIPEKTKGIVWYGPDVAYTTCFAPFPVRATALPDAYQKGNPQKFDMDIAWWLFDFVASWSRLNFQRMCHVDILPKQAELEAEMREQLLSLDDDINKGTPRNINQFCQDVSARIIEQWQQLAMELIAKYSDGYINLPDQKMPVEIGYPARWLIHTDYSEGPTTYEMKPNHLHDHA